MKIAYNTINGLVVQELALVPEFEHLLVTEEIQVQINGMVNPKIIDGVVVETASPEEILQANAPIVPSEVPLWKLRFILGQMGLENAVSSAINGLSEPMRSAGNYLWNHGTAVERYSPTVSLIKQALTLDDAEADEIFVKADLVKL